MYVYLVKPSLAIINNPIGAKTIQTKIKVDIKLLANEKTGFKNKSGTKNDNIKIDTDLKKKNSQTVTITDLPDKIGFGNGVTVLRTGIRLKNGEHVPCVFAVFDNDTDVTMAKVKASCQ